MQKTHNTLPEEIRIQSVALLNKHLAAAIDLHAQMKQAHWNVRGPGFIAIHELFDRVSTEVENYSDLLAERAAPLTAPCKSPQKNPFLSPIRLASPTRRSICLPCRAHSRRLAGRSSRRLPNQPRLKTQRRRISSRKFRAASISNSILLNRISRPKPSSHSPSSMTLRRN